MSERTIVTEELIGSRTNKISSYTDKVFQMCYYLEIIPQQSTGVKNQYLIQKFLGRTDSALAAPSQPQQHGSSKLSLVMNPSLTFWLRLGLRSHF